MRVPNIGTKVRAQVSVLCCPEGTTGYVKAILAQGNVPEVVIRTYLCGDVAVSARDFPFFFEEPQEDSGALVLAPQPN